VFDEGRVKILPAVDGAGSKSLKPVQSLAAHHHWEVGRHDVVVAIGSSYGDGVGAESSPGVGVAVELVDADWLKRGGPRDASESVGEG
jgi:hypothetical protein